MLEKVANTVRGLSADAVQKANSGHPGLPLGSAEIGSLLYGEIMKYDPREPDWPDRDRFVLSAGHGSMLVYSLLHLAGYDLSLEDLKNFRQLKSRTPGHPEIGCTPGVETTTGPLGQGFANAVGMAIAEKMLARRFNTADDRIIDHFTYTLLGDGGMMEGVVAEAASLAGYLGLGKLIAIYDDNNISIEGETNLTFTEDVGERFRAYNWQVIEDVNGQDLNELREAVKKAQGDKERPSLIIAKTKIAFGAPNLEGSAAAHGAPLGEDEIKGMKEKLGLPEEKFYVPVEVKEFFSERAEELQLMRKQWEEKFAHWAEKNPDLKVAWDKGHGLELPENFRETIESMEIKTPAATRKASGAVLQKVAAEVEYLVGGSADLAPSNKTYLEGYGDIKQGDFQGRNFHFGVREHAMGSVVNGISLHRGLRPFCATFLVFSDYMRPAIRLAALMKQPVIYVFTHDSFHVGEDGPTHQPVEQVESLRLIPGLKVIRPADEQETKLAWIMALERNDGPTALILTRQGLPHLDKDDSLEGFFKGGYVVEKEEEGNPDITLMASGSEVSLAVEVAAILRQEGQNPRVVSIPDREAFLAQKVEYKEKVLGNSPFRVALEAGVGQGWYRLLGEKYHLVSLESFGESGPGAEVATEFGFIAEPIARDILKKMDK